uniref:Uncharacterized protein n=1 Tax=Wolbachia endosymbiont of Aleurodicus dispersus TaxID=1288877 RepID=A0A3B0JIE2_9RICK
MRANGEEISEEKEIKFQGLVTTLKTPTMD